MQARAESRERSCRTSAVQLGVPSLRPMAVVVAVVVAYATLGILTGVGSLRRDDTWTMAMASGVAFPVAWVAW